MEEQISARQDKLNLIYCASESDVCRAISKLRWSLYMTFYRFVVVYIPYIVTCFFVIMLYILTLFLFLVKLINLLFSVCLLLDVGLFVLVK